MAPVRVLFLVNSLVAHGTERNVASLCEHIDKSRYHPEVWTLIDGFAMEKVVRDAGISLQCLQRRRSFDPIFALRAARKISRQPVDLIHAFLPAIAFNAALAKAVWNAPAPLIYSEGTSTQIRGWMSNLHQFVLHR